MYIVQYTRMDLTSGKLLSQEPSDGVPIGRWHCSQEFFGTPWSNKSDAQPLEGDYMKFVLACLNAPN